MKTWLKGADFINLYQQTGALMGFFKFEKQKSACLNIQCAFLIY